MATTLGLPNVLVLDAGGLVFESGSRDKQLIFSRPKKAHSIMPAHLARTEPPAESLVRRTEAAPTIRKHHWLRGGLLRLDAESRSGSTLPLPNRSEIFSLPCTRCFYKKVLRWTEYGSSSYSWCDTHIFLKVLSPARMLQMENKKAV